MTARDEVAALPGGAGASIANSVKPVYAADPGSITGIANDLTTAAGSADGCNTVSTAVGEQTCYGRSAMAGMPHQICYSMPVRQMRSL
jgi:hypothetical protein